MLPKRNKPGGGRKRKLSTIQRDSILKSKMPVKMLALEYSVNIDVIYHIFRDRNKPNINFI